MDTYKNIPTYHAPNRQAWRSWLSANHSLVAAVWLIIYRKESGTPSVYYPEAVDEALCFGWIDSKPNKRDADSYYVYFSKRNPKSNWSGVNKQKVEKLLAEGLMTEAGLAMITLAKATGTWNALQTVDSLEEPADLREAFNQNPEARQQWEGFAPSARRGILEWILNAKRPDTRQKRISQTVALAAEGKKANFPAGKT